MNAVPRAFYQRLAAQGKLPTVALVACKHTLLSILNALVRHGTPLPPSRRGALLRA